jgi:transposase
MDVEARAVELHAYAEPDVAWTDLGERTRDLWRRRATLTEDWDQRIERCEVRVEKILGPYSRELTPMILAEEIVSAVIEEVFR